MEPGGMEIEPPADPDTIFGDKPAYLEAFRERMRPRLEAERASWPRGRVDILAELQEWFEPVLDLADRTAAAINGRVLLDLGDPQVVLDLWTRRVYALEGDECEYRFVVDPALVEQ